MLKNAGLSLARQEPELRNDLQTILGKNHALLALPDPAADPVKVPLLSVRQLDLDRHVLAQQFLESDLVLFLSQHLEVEAKQLADPLIAAKSDEKELVLP
jgi:hypothetical protein